MVAKMIGREPFGPPSHRGPPFSWQQMLVASFALLVSATIGWLDAVALLRLYINFLNPHDDLAVACLGAAFISGFALSRLLKWSDGTKPAAVQALFLISLVLSQAAAVEAKGGFGCVSTALLFAVVGAANFVRIIPVSSAGAIDAGAKSAKCAFCLGRPAIVSALPWLVLLFCIIMYFGVPVGYPEPWVIGVPFIILFYGGLWLMVMTVIEQDP